jgi:omega-6 fatty acid desaturase (delta-12 desaturase)
MTVKQNISTFRASDKKAFSYLAIPLFMVSLGLYLSLQEKIIVYVIGQLMLSLFFAQTFILLHECGHMNFFNTRALNLAFGNLFGFLTIIPFYSWQHMHNLHHRWTGWRDKDPTTEKTVEPSKSPFMRVFANVAWLLFIPVFYLSYKLSNYWNIGKIKRYLKARRYYYSLLSIAIYLCLYIGLFYSFWDFISILLLPAFILSLIWKELIILTQHSHVEIPISNGEVVRPVAFKDQVPFTRSFYTFKWVEEYLLFNFNLHEAHHIYPGLPAYWLSKIELNKPKEPYYSDWFRQAKSLKGEDYILRTSKHTGKKF